MPASTFTLSHPTAAKQSRPCIASLREMLLDRFPEEAASADLSNDDSVLRLAMDLLHRLWRWEN